MIADRYPQAQFPGISDGPLLDGWSGKRWPLSAIAAWEARPYLDADANGPDLVLRLNVGQAAAEARRPEHDPIDLARRRALVRSLRFADPRTTVVEIDADLPYEDVLAASLEAIERCRQTSGDPAALKASLRAGFAAASVVVAVVDRAHRRHQPRISAEHPNVHDVLGAAVPLAFDTFAWRFSIAVPW